MLLSLNLVKYSLLNSACEIFTQNISVQKLALKKIK